MQASSIFVGLVMLAAVFDVSWRKIPNFFNFSILGSGLLINAIAFGWEGLWTSMLAVVITLAVLLFPFALNVYRGGDVKLCMGMSAWLGIKQGLWVIGLGIIGGGCLGFLILLLNQKSKKKNTVPMAVCFAGAGLWIQRFGIPFHF
jgi:Flp pilus assembly protein protease CpaA